MMGVPFVVLTATSKVVDASERFETTTSEDPLPLTVDVSADGIAMARITRITEVKPETTDDK